MNWEGLQKQMFCPTVNNILSFLKELRKIVTKFSKNRWPWEKITMPSEMETIIHNTQ
jgi:hypothetical protein